MADEKTRDPKAVDKVADSPGHPTPGKTATKQPEKSVLPAKSAKRAPKPKTATTAKPAVKKTVAKAKAATKPKAKTTPAAKKSRPARQPAKKAAARKPKDQVADLNAPSYPLHPDRIWPD